MIEPVAAPRRFGPRGEFAASPPEEFVLDGAPTARVRLVDVGLACCGIEVSAAVTGGALRAVTSDSAPASPSTPIEILVVAGTLTHAMAPAVIEAYRASSAPPWVVAYGACADSGGPYWDSYAVARGVEQVMPVDLCIAGCPPRPDALVAGLREVTDRAHAGGRPAATTLPETT